MEEPPSEAPVVSLKKRKYKTACLVCRRDHRACDGKRPCGHCIATRKEASCVDAPPLLNKTKKPKKRKFFLVNEQTFSADRRAVLLQQQKQTPSTPGKKRRIRTTVEVVINEGILLIHFSLLIHSSIFVDDPDVAEPQNRSSDPGPLKITDISQSSQPSSAQSVQTKPPSPPRPPPSFAHLLNPWSSPSDPQQEYPSSSLADVSHLRRLRKASFPRAHPNEEDRESEYTTNLREDTWPPPGRDPMYRTSTYMREEDRESNGRSRRTQALSLPGSPQHPQHTLQSRQEMVDKMRELMRITRELIEEQEQLKEELERTKGEQKRMLSHTSTQHIISRRGPMHNTMEEFNELRPRDFNFNQPYHAQHPSSSRPPHSRASHKWTRSPHAITPKLSITAFTPFVIDNPLKPFMLFRVLFRGPFVREDLSNVDFQRTFVSESLCRLLRYSQVYFHFYFLFFFLFFLMLFVFVFLFL